MVETQIDRLMDSYASRLEQQGISLELYLQYMQMSTDKLREDLKEAAVTQIKQQLALDAVVAAEEIVVSDEDVEEEVKKAAANLNVPYERVTEGLDREALKVDLARDRAMAAVAVAAKPNLIAADAEDGEIKLTEVTKDEEKAAEETEAKPKKRTTKAKAKTEETAEDGEEKKPAAKTRKAPAKRTPAAKKTAAPQVSLTLQYMGKELSQEDMVAAVKAQWTGEEIKTLALYVKPEDQAVYYVVNGEGSGKVDL